MFVKICPVCKNQFYGNNKYLDESVWHDKCGYKKKSKKSKKNQPLRTSTPISHLEENSTPSFSDSVAEFFYQSWKSGLFSDDSARSLQHVDNQIKNQMYPVPQPVYTTQVVYVNTVMYQPLPCFPGMNTYTPNVGYRNDGTFGLLPLYYPYGF